MVFCVLMRNPARAAEGHNQENQTGDLQPQLVQYLPESAGRCGDSTLHRPHRTAAINLLPGDARHYSDLLCGRNLAHDSILTVCRSTMTQTCAMIETISAGVGI